MVATTLLNDEFITQLAEGVSWSLAAGHRPAFSSEERANRLGACARLKGQTVKDFVVLPKLVLNLHGLLSNNLLSDPKAEGRLRFIEVEISQSSFHPLSIPQLIEECFQQILRTAEAIKDPFEQSFFVIVHLPYLQPFDDVNKRVSRLAANIPLIKANLVPLTFLDVPRDLYTQAILGVYELNRVELLKDMYLWAYQRSAERYAAVRQSHGEPDPFRLKYRDELRHMVSTVVQNQFSREDAFRYLEEWSGDNIHSDDREKFLEKAEDEILSLHEGNYARYRISPSEFEGWQKIWEQR